METEKKGGELKLLGFVRAAAITTLVWLSNVYDYAKHNSGPLKTAVATVEGAVTATIAPLYHQFEAVPPQLLSFLDRKIDEITIKFEERASPVAGQVHSIVNKATQTAQELLHQAQVGGPSAAARYAASEAKELVLTGTVVVWTKLDRIAPFHAMAVPTAAHWSERYNRLVTNMSRRGYAVFCYLPLLPVDDIAKAFKQAESKPPAMEVDAE